MVCPPAGRDHYGLFAEHFCDDKNQKGAAQTTAQQKVNQGESKGSEHGRHGSNHGFLEVED